MPAIDVESGAAGVPDAVSGAAMCRCSPPDFTTDRSDRAVRVPELPWPSQGLTRKKVGDWCRDELRVAHLHEMVAPRYYHCLGVRDQRQEMLLECLDERTALAPTDVQDRVPRREDRSRSH